MKHREPLSSGPYQQVVVVVVVVVVEIVRVESMDIGPHKYESHFVLLGHIHHKQDHLSCEKTPSLPTKVVVVHAIVSVPHNTHPWVVVVVVVHYK